MFTPEIKIVSLLLAAIRNCAAGNLVTGANHVFVEDDLAFANSDPVAARLGIDAIISFTD